MTAVASPPSFPHNNRSAWGSHASSSMNSDEFNRMFMPRKTLERNNSSSSISSTASASSTSTVNSAPSQQNSNGSSVPSSPDLTSWQNNPNASGPANGNPASSGGTAAAPRKRTQAKAPLFASASKSDPALEFPSRALPLRQAQSAQSAPGQGLNASAMHNQSSVLPSQGQMPAQHGMARPLNDPMQSPSQPVLYLLSLNGTFERKTISVPFSPDTLRIGRQTNAKTVPTPINGFFDSKVLSRQHAEVWADRQGKVWIRDVKSSNGTFVNGTRLSQENRESEPHELQSSDHLELGIDIVSEDQKTVVHHKVAAKVEHAGFPNPSSNLLDMNFGDLDPTNGSMVMPHGALPFRGRSGSQLSNGRMVPGNGMMAHQTSGMSQQRGFFFSPISTEQIVKKIQGEMRTARLQSRDLSRTGRFIDTLLSEEDIKDLKDPEPEPSRSHVVNGNGNLSFRTDPKTRFSDPPAPPPQQPLPEKPDVPALKRGTTERPKSNNQNMSPIRQEGNMSQILQLTEALNNAKKEIETQTSRMKDLEDMLLKERQAREVAQEELAKRMEDTRPEINGVTADDASETTIIEQAFEPPTEATQADAMDLTDDGAEEPPAEAEGPEEPATDLHAQIEAMVQEMTDLRQQLDGFRQRAETAETERDTDRQTLAEMALQIRRETEAREALAREATRPTAEAQAAHQETQSVTSEGSTLVRTPSSGSLKDRATPEELVDKNALSRTSTITPKSGTSELVSRDQMLANSLPYASMIGVVVIGMGLMAYLNGWQAQPRLDR